MNNKAKVMQFISGPNDTYEQVRGRILSMDLFPSIQRVYAVVVSDEKEHIVYNGIPSVNEDVAMNTRAYVDREQFRNPDAKVKRKTNFVLIVEEVEILRRIVSC